MSSNLTIVNWCPGDPCDPCALVGHCFFIGAQPFGTCPPVCPFSWQAGNAADVGMVVNVSIQFTITGTDTNPTFSISGTVGFTGQFHYSQLNCPAHDIGKIVGGINNIAIAAHSTSSYGSPFCGANGYWQSPDCQVQAIAGGTLYSIDVYQIQSDGSKVYIGAGGGFSGG